MIISIIILLSAEIIVYISQFNPGESVAQKFLAAENQRARELEKLIDSHIESLRKGTEATIKRHTKR